MEEKELERFKKALERFKKALERFKKALERFKKALEKWAPNTSPAPKQESAPQEEEESAFVPKQESAPQEEEESAFKRAIRASENVGRALVIEAELP